MPNNDDTYGTFNKRTHIYSQETNAEGYQAVDEIVTFANTTEAKNLFLPSALQTVYDECCTTLQWALVADGNGDNTKLKVTFDFGTKGAGTAEADDWAAQFNTRKAGVGQPTVPSGINFTQETITDASSGEHLF
jgi:hypothetical protein